MFFHTVLLRLGATYDAHCRVAFDAYAARVTAAHPTAAHYVLLPNVASTHKGFNHALFSMFDSRAAFIAYDESTLHQEIKSFLAPHVEELAVADGELTHDHGA